MHIGAGLALSIELELKYVSKIYGHWGKVSIIYQVRVKVCFKNLWTLGQG